MNFSKEFGKIKLSFNKVKEDITFLSDKIYDNYDEFMGHHLKLVKEVKLLSENIKSNSLKIIETPKHKFSDKKLFNLEGEIKEIKKIIKDIQKGHLKITSNIDDIKSNKKNIKDLKEKYKNSELEIYLLKDRLLEKDVELKQIKDINRHMFNTLDELTKIEIELLTKK